METTILRLALHIMDKGRLEFVPPMVNSLPGCFLRCLPAAGGLCPEGVEKTSALVSSTTSGLLDAAEGAGAELAEAEEDDN